MLPRVARESHVGAQQISKVVSLDAGCVCVMPRVHGRGAELIEWEFELRETAPIGAKDDLRGLSRVLDSLCDAS